MSFLNMYYPSKRVSFQSHKEEVIKWKIQTGKTLSYGVTLALTDMTYLVSTHQK